MSQQVNARYVRTAKKPGCDMIKVIIPGRNQEGEWVDCPSNVKAFANKAFQEGEEAILTGDLVNNKYNITRIEKINSAVNTQTSSPVQAPLNIPSISSVPLAPPKNYMNPKTPEESEQILKLSVYASACEAIKTLTGQVDVNTITDVIEVIYKKGVNLVKN